MPLAFALRLVIVWALQPARSGSILFIPHCLQWAHPSLSILFLLSGEICGNISGRQNEIPGIIYKKACSNFFCRPEYDFNRNQITGFFISVSILKFTLSPSRKTAIDRLLKSVTEKLELLSLYFIVPAIPVKSLSL